MTIEEKRRKLFEAWMGEQGLESEWEPLRNCYKDFPAHFAWQAFNVALDAVVIELPFVIDYTGSDLAIEDCRAAIESTGLGLKVLP